MTEKKNNNVCLNDDCPDNSSYVLAHRKIYIPGKSRDFKAHKTKCSDGSCDGSEGTEVYSCLPTVCLGEGGMDLSKNGNYFLKKIE